MNENDAVAIVGGGFCGMVAATRLLREGSGSVLLFESVGTPNGGRAYGGSEPTQWLNVPSARMSAFPEVPGDFVEWLEAARVPPTDGFALRHHYGSYLSARLAEAEARHPGRLSVVPESVVAIEPGFLLKTRSGSSHSARSVILATGYGEARPPRWPGSYHALQPDSWPSTSSKNVVVIGTGLTAMDAVVAVLARNPSASIYCVSRHGIRHKGFQYGQCPWRLTDAPADGGLRSWLKWIREQVRKANEMGASWVEVFDALRPEWDTIWTSLNERDQRRVLRLRRNFDQHRHRVPPPTERKAQEGNVRYLAGRIMEVGPHHVRILTSEGEAELAADLVLDATGQTFDELVTRQELIRDLVSLGLLRHHRLGLGVEVAPSSHALYVVGPLSRGQRWETTAVAELREQVRSVCWEIINSRESTS